MTRRRALWPHSCFIIRMMVMLTVCCVAQANHNANEFQVKAAFLYNFATFTEWPDKVGKELKLCIYGEDSFGSSLENLQGKPAASRLLSVQRVHELEKLQNCQVIFITQHAIDQLPQILSSVNGLPVLTIADSPGAEQSGVILNMRVESDRITFRANLIAARNNGLSLSARMLRLATDVIQ